MTWDEQVKMFSTGLCMRGKGGKEGLFQSTSNLTHRKSTGLLGAFEAPTN